MRSVLVSPDFYAIHGPLKSAGSKRTDVPRLLV